MIALFCPNCHSIIFPENGVLKCKKCGMQPNSVKEQKITTDFEDKRTIVQSTSEPVLPTVEIECPKCGFMKATVTVRQTRAADEPETMIYRCCNPKCNYNWREY